MGINMSVRKRRTRPAVTILIAALICVAITILIILMLGFRYISTDKGIRFIGKIEGGQPITGTIKYPNGQKATLDYFSSTITYDNGDLYTGEIKGIYRSGRGTMVYDATGDRYEGDFYEDEITGSGVYTYSNGDIYEGALLEGKMHGNGVITFASGAKYEGNFNYGVRSGYGVYVWSSGTKYDGAFADDVKHGFGKMTYANGDYYEGQFVEDKRQGNGTYTWEDGESYSGNFNNNLIDTRIINSSGKYLKNDDGTFVHGSEGVYTFTTGRKYTGYFEAGKVVGVDIDINQPTS